LKQQPRAAGEALRYAPGVRVPVRNWFVFPMTVGIAAVCLAFFLLSCPCGAAAAQVDEASTADADWRAILALDAGPPMPAEGAIRTREAALARVRQHLDRQEMALRNFPLAHPSDPRRFSARVRLADVLFARTRLLQDGAAQTRARQLLDEVEADSAATPKDRADAAYARVSQAMQAFSAGSATAPGGREALAGAIRAFDRAYPADPRTPALLVELATLYDAQPTQKKALLDEALARLSASTGGSDNLRMRIADDLRRLALLGKPVEFHLPPALATGRPAAAGATFDETLASHRGHVVVLLFWATWSAPSLAELVRLQEISARCDPRRVEFLTLSLDEDRAALTEAVKQLRLAWPVYCDSRGWSGEAVRSVGLNALPTIWVLAPDGTLTALNARGRAEEFIRQAMAASSRSGR